MDFQKYEPFSPEIIENRLETQNLDFIESMYKIISKALIIVIAIEQFPDFNTINKEELNEVLKKLQSK